MKSPFVDGKLDQEKASEILKELEPELKKIAESMPRSETCNLDDWIQEANIQAFKFMKKLEGDMLNTSTPTFLQYVQSALKSNRNNGHI